MFLHLGEDMIIPKSVVIGIFDLEKCKNSLVSREFLEIAKSENKITSIGDANKAKTFIVTLEGIYLSPISSVTLFKRSAEILKEI